MFRKSFWTSKKRTQQVQQKRNNFVFASAQHARQRISRVRHGHGNQVLNSTSAGASTVDVYIQREMGDEEFVFEDPDYQMTANAPPHAAPTGDMDLEKGNGFRTEIVRSDSAFPVVIEDDDEDGGRSAGSGDTRSSQSRR